LHLNNQKLKNMKVVKLLSLLFVAAFIFSACNNETAEPTINWDGNLSKTMDFEVEADYLIDIDVAVNAEAGIKSFMINKYVYEGEDYSTIEITGPAGYVDEIDYTYNFMYLVDQSDFPAGVTKIEFEFEVIDNEDRAVTKVFTVFNTDYYTLTFDVKDAFGSDVADAIVTFNGVEFDAGEYVIEFVEPGTYDYSVAKDGYETVTVTDYEVTEDATIEVELIQLLSAYSENVLITQSVTSAYATYNGVRVEDTENTVIGVKYDTNTTDRIVIKTTANCEGWVIVADDSYTSYDEIATAYTNGTAVTETELEYDYDSKPYSTVYFISKVDGAYLLVKYVDGFVNPNAHDGNLGNIIAFQYKN
jgi:hypothetical protein